MFAIVRLFFVVVETKFLLSRHLATNSLGLGRLFYKSGHQLQNSRHHREQNVATWRVEQGSF